MISGVITPRVIISPSPDQSRTDAASGSEFAGNQRAAGAWRGHGVAKDLSPFVDLFFEFVFVDEAVDLDGAEEVADP